MYKRIKLLLAVTPLFFGAAFILSGCGTTKGIATGVGATAVGIKDDAKEAWKGICKADEWMKKNAW